MREQIAELKNELKEERHSAQSSRARLYNRMDEMGRQNVKTQEDVSGLKEEVAAVDRKLGDVKQVTDKVTRWQLMAVGIILTISALMAVLGGLVTGYWQKLVLMFKP